MSGLSLVLGPARSGKSRLAERLAASSGRQVLYVATLQPLDEEMEQRVLAHRSSRPPGWRTLEEPLRLVERLRDDATDGLVLLDCLTLWVSNLLLEAGSDDAARARNHVLGAVRGLIDWQSVENRPLIVVSNEAGAGLVPEYALGRQYRDLLGEANQLVAAAADAFYVTFAGQFLELKSLGAQPVEKQ